ncbi:30S ribosomal protein S20 [Zavarzinella formosa]|uniref:30S ribosomal protein S20 n=1 Tax=Zavarzinella formosa TaxID=360055 RepID=UPI0002DB1BA9|nr:30S ribosomal protein S20 [Zavarzinella formosa]
MPHTSSAKKSLRQDAKRKERNRAVKKVLKTTLKKFATVLPTGTPEQKQAEYNASAKQLDKAAAKGVIHKNAAARKKSQLAKKLAIKK